MKKTIYECDRCGVEIADVAYTLTCYAEDVNPGPLGTISSNVAVQNTNRGRLFYIHRLFDFLPVRECENDLSRSAKCSTDPKPFPSYTLSNNNATIRNTRARIEELEKRQAEPAPEGWTFDGGEVVINAEINRLQILFDERPDYGLKEELKRYGFRWAPSQNAWQRQLTENAINAAKHITGEG